MKYIRIKATDQNMLIVYMAMAVQFPEAFSIRMKFGMKGNFIEVHNPDTKKLTQLKNYIKESTV